jgi:hypothetical protein
MVEAAEAQRVRLQRPGANADRWAGAGERFRADPHREPDETLSALISYIEPGDTVLDVGGGAGRYGLPLALRCRELINVEPSAGMGSEFESAARDAGIANARWVHADWLGAPEPQADVTLVANVTYFVRDIGPFIDKLVRASRRRVMLLLASIPSPNQRSDVFAVLNGEPQALLPGHRELLPVLWDMGILPDILVLGDQRPTQPDRLAGETFPTREAAIESLVGDLADPDRRAAARARADSDFETLFVPADGGFQRRSGPRTRYLLITWQTAR